MISFKLENHSLNVLPPVIYTRGNTYGSSHKTCTRGTSHAPADSYTALRSQRTHLARKQTPDTQTIHAHYACFIATLPKLYNHSAHVHVHAPAQHETLHIHDREELIIVQ